MSYLEEFNRIVQRENYLEFLKLWEEYCYSESIDAKELLEIINLVKNSSLKKQFGQHVEKIIPLWQSLPSSTEKDLAIEVILDIESTNSDTLANTAYDYLKEKYGKDKFFNEKIRLVGLRSKINFQKAISGYKLLSHLDVGNFVFHTAGWGTGEILDLSLIREELTLEFEYVMGERHLTFEKALNTLVPLSKEHFLARRFGDPDELEKEAKNDPIKVITMLLNDLGPKTALEMKDELCELVIPESDWSKWWQNARSKLKKSTAIITPTDNNEPFMLRKKAVTREELLYSQLEKKPNIEDTLLIIYSFIRDYAETLKNEEFKNNLIAKLNEIMSFEELKDSYKIQILFLLYSISHDNTKKDEIKKLLLNVVEYGTFIEEIKIISYKKKTLQYIKDVKENWVDIFLDQLLDIKENLVRDYILSELISSKEIDKLTQKLTLLIQNSTLHPKVFVWYFQKLLKKEKNLPLSDRKSFNKFFEGFMILLDFIYNKPMYKDLSKKMHHILVGNRFKIVRDYMAHAPIEDVKEFLLLSTKCQILSTHEVKIMHSLAEVVFPELKSLRNSDKKETQDYEVFWTTQEGYEKIHEKIKYLSTTETVKNAQEIEEARSHGDLRENAEYKAALERRDRLQAEIKLLSEQIHKAKIITKNDVNTKKVGIGTIVHCKKQNGEKVTFTILGPFEADPEKSILSFQSQLAQNMIDKTIGDSFSYQNEIYSIEEISSFFE